MTIAAARDLQTGRPSSRTTPARRCAVVWINGRKASVATMGADGRSAICEVERGLQEQLSYLAMVVRAIGDRDRVVVLGPGSMRLALEREYVAIHHRPDRLVDVEPAGAVDRLELIRRLRELAD